MNDNIHEIEWCQQTISAFWNRLGTAEHLTDLYFSRQRGASVLRRVRRLTEVKGQVVDLGCGPGYFIEHLLAAGIACAGADLSADSIARVNHRLAGHPLFLGARVSKSLTEVPFPEQSVDVLFFLEAIEHLLPGDRGEYLSHIYRALAPSGRLIVTVPYEEDLERGKVVCPRCGCRFHRMQHVSSFSASILNTEMESHGFKTLFCRPVLLLPEWHIYFAGLRAESANPGLGCPECGHEFNNRRALLERLAGKAKPKKLFHLLYVGQRTKEG